MSTNLSVHDLTRLRVLGMLCAPTTEKSSLKLEFLARLIEGDVEDSFIDRLNADFTARPVLKLD